MKKEELRSALGRIKPREALVDYTIAKMHMEKEKQERQRGSLFPAFMMNKGMRLAGACCVFALIVGICLIALGGNITPNDTESTPMLSDTVKTRSSELEPSTYSLFDDEGNGWILASGDFGECLYRPDPDEFPEISGTVALKFSVTELHAYSNTLSVDIEKTSADIVIIADFGDYEYADEFLAEATAPMIVRATPNDDGSWTLLDYSFAEAEE